MSEWVHAEQAVFVLANDQQQHQQQLCEQLGQTNAQAKQKYYFNIKKQRQQPVMTKVQIKGTALLGAVKWMRPPQTAISMSTTKQQSAHMFSKAA